MTTFFFFFWEGIGGDFTLRGSWFTPIACHGNADRIDTGGNQQRINSHGNQDSITTSGNQDRIGSHGNQERV